MSNVMYNNYQVIATWNGIEVFTQNGKYGLYHPENDVFVQPVYDKIEWDKDTNFIYVVKGDKVGYLSAEDGHFMDFYENVPDDPYMMAIPYEEYLKEEWPDWFIMAGKATA